MEIGLLSHQISAETASKFSGRWRFLLDVLEGNQDLDLLVTAGWSVPTEKELKKLDARFGNGKTVIAVEVGRILRPHSKSTTGRIGGLVLVGGNQPMRQMGDQVIVQADDFKGPAAIVRERTQRLLDTLVNERQFTCSDQKSLWLECGEILMLKYDRSTMRVSFRADREIELIDRLRHLIRGCGLIIHPTHDSFGYPHQYLARALALSGGVPADDGLGKLGRRTYCRVSNWRVDKPRADSSKPEKIHLILDGKKQLRPSMTEWGGREPCSLFTRYST